MRASITPRVGIPPLIAVLLGCALLCASATTYAGLYGDEGKDITKGELNDQDYWWTKFDMKMLDLAIQQHQPEGRIGVELAGTLRRLDDLSKKYPKHEEIQEWKKHANEVNGKIDPNASRSESFKPGCPWEESNFAQAWVNFYWAKMLIADKQRDQALGLLQNVKQNLDILLKPDRLKDYPEDLRKWVEDAKPEADKMYADLKEQARH